MQTDRLTHLETIIAKNQCRFYEIGKALKEIKDARLYKLTFYESFEAYAGARWDMGRSQAYRLIDAYHVVSNLSPIGDILPGNEAQTRPLAQLHPFEQRKVWRDFLDTGMEITAPNIKRFIAESKAARKEKSIDLTDRISPEFMSVVQQMLEQVRLAHNDQWRKTSRQAALLWNRVIREKITSKEKTNVPG